jgi:hypothetical protein
MQKMKQHQLELKHQFPNDEKVIESFPAFWFYEFSLTGQISDRIRIGGMVGFTSTGGRMDYRDYSGRIECNQVATGWTVAGRGEVLLNPRSKWPVYFTTKLGTVFGLYNLDLSIDVNDDKSANNLKFQSINVFIEPGFTASKTIVGPLSATLTAGYNLNVVKGKQKLSSDSNLFLLDNSNNKVTLDWSGFRIGAGLAVSFEKM